MKTLITTLNSQYIHSNLAIKYLYTVCAEDIRNIEIREYTINNEDSYIYGEIVKGDYDIVAFSCYIWNIEKTLELTENLHKACPGMKIILGGPEVSYDAVELMMKRHDIDFIIQGEGEYTFHRLMLCLQGAADNAVNPGMALAGIDGLVYRHEGRVYINQPPQMLQMDSVPFPYKYIVPRDDQIIYYESSRGCPRRCAYCLSSIEKHVRSLSMDRVKSDIRYFLLKRVPQVKFIDRTFNYDKARALEIIRYIISSDNGVTNFHFEMCADLIDDETIRVLSLARKGLFQFEIGVQSTNRETLDAVNRSTDVRVVLERIAQIVELGNIEVHADLIAGLPFEDYKSFAASFNNVYRVMPHKLHLGFLKLLKGTAIRREADRFGYVYREKAPYEVISNSFISAKDLVKLHRIEKILDIYYNRGGFERTLAYLTTECAKSPFQLYEELSDYYYLKGYQHSNHKKEDNYRIMDGFAKYKERSIPDAGAAVRELLTLDMKDALNSDAVKKFERKGWEIG